MFVDRDQANAVKGVYAVSQHEGQEELPDDDPEVVACLERINDPVPSTIGKGQLLRWLDAHDLLASVDAAVAQAGGLTQRLWQEAPTFPRHDPMVIAIATAIGMTEADLDEVYREAAQL